MRNLLAASLLAFAVSGMAYAADEAKEIELKDGSTVIIHKDGKMSMRDKRGRATSMKAGTPMETKDGKVLMMRGNEMWRKLSKEELGSY